MTVRTAARLLGRQVQQRACRRNFNTSSAFLDAQNLMMPALSPTMTEGNIASWKVKEGDTFSTGDILLEVETDKATMDVEAQDDGVMAKIFIGDGEKGVKVGTRIAVLAESDDDISSLEIPPDNSKPIESADEEKPREEKAETKQAEPAPEPEKSEPKKEKKPAKKSSGPAPTGPGQNKKYPLYPSVIALIHQNHLSDDDVAKIPATGPQNRVLKGDVLAYLGSIEKSYSSEQSARITKAGHLDLSNIKVAKQEASSTGPVAGPPGTFPDPAFDMPKTTTIALPITLTEVLKVQKRVEDTLGVSISLSTFLGRAVDFANDDLPRPKGAKPTSDELFNAVLGLNSVPTSVRGAYIPQIDALPLTSIAKAAMPAIRTKAPDVYDFLTGRAKIAPKTPAVSATAAPLVAASPVAGGATNVFSLTVPAGEEKLARTFLERMKTVLQVEPGRLVL